VVLGEPVALQATSQGALRPARDYSGDAHPGAGLLAWRLTVFDLSIEKILVLLVLAVVIFGPERLPKLAQQAGRALRDLRRLADSATRDLKEGLGPEFADFDVTDLHPKNFVRKHLLDDEFDMNDLDPRKFVRKHVLDGSDLDEPDEDEPDGDEDDEQMEEDATAVAGLSPGEAPPYDSEAT
jgi:sec-independent protein translocase protein TatB